jgi:hypothetical protein
MARSVVQNKELSIKLLRRGSRVLGADTTNRPSTFGGEPRSMSVFGDGRSSSVFGGEVRTLSVLGGDPTWSLSVNEGRSMSLFNEECKLKEEKDRRVPSILDHQYKEDTDAGRVNLVSIVQEEVRRSVYKERDEIASGRRSPLSAITIDRAESSSSRLSFSSMLPVIPIQIDPRNSDSGKIQQSARPSTTIPNSTPTANNSTLTPPSKSTPPVYSKLTPPVTTARPERHSISSQSMNREPQIRVASRSPSAKMEKEHQSRTHSALPPKLPEIYSRRNSGSNSVEKYTGALSYSRRSSAKRNSQTNIVTVSHESLRNRKSKRTQPRRIIPLRMDDVLNGSDINVRKVGNVGVFRWNVLVKP